MGARLLANLNGGALVGGTSPGIVAVRGAKGAGLHAWRGSGVLSGASSLLHLGRAAPGQRENTKTCC